MKSAKNPVAELDQAVLEFHKSAERWRTIRTEGCGDPFWPDGLNMNLVRNHMIYYKRQMIELCEEYGMIQPEEIYGQLPPAVPDNLWTSPTNTDRHERILGWKNQLIYPTAEEYQFSEQQEAQLTLF